MADIFSKYGGIEIQDPFSKYGGSSIIEPPQLPTLPSPFKPRDSVPSPVQAPMNFGDVWNLANQPIQRIPKGPDYIENQDDQIPLLGSDTPYVPPRDTRAVVESLSTPLSLATSLAGPIGKVSPIAGNIIGKGAGALQLGEGVRDLSQGNYGSGLVNLGMGALGVGQKFGRVPEAMPEVLPPENLGPKIIPGKMRLNAAPEPKGLLGPATNSEIIPRDPEVIANLDAGSQLLEPEYPIKINPPQTGTIGKNQIYYRGNAAPPPQSTGVPDIVVPNRLKPVTPAESFFNSMIPERFKRPGEMVSPNAEVQFGSSGPMGNEYTIPGSITSKFDDATRFDVESPKPIDIKPQELPVYGGRENPQSSFDRNRIKTGPTITVTNPNLPGAKKFIKTVQQGDFVKAAEEVPKNIESPLNWEDKVQDWHFAKQASNLSGKLESKKFTELDPLGQKAISDIQEGSNLSGVRDYFNKKFKEVQAVIPDIKFRENYLPQLWDNSPEEIQMVFGPKKLSLKPSFTMNRVIEDYKTGIEKGLKPKFNTVSDLVGWYESKANKAIADRNLWNYGKDAGLISVSRKDGFVAMNPDLFPFMVDKSNQGKVFYGNPQFVNAIENQLRDNSGTITHKVARSFAFAKNTALTGGIPGTGVNWHSLTSIPNRQLVTSGVSDMLRTYYHDVVPGAAKSFIEDNLGDAVDAVRHRLNLGAEGFQAGSNEERNLAQKFEGAFSDRTFKEIIPAAKLKAWQDLWPKFVAKGYDITKAKQAASQFVNDTRGGVNNVMQSPEFKDWMHIILLAPDWAQTKLNIGKNAILALKNPSDPLGQEYMKTAAKMALVYSTEAALGNELRKKIPSSISRQTNIPIGTVKNPNGQVKDAELTPSGSALDTVGLPIQVGTDLAKGNLSGAAMRGVNQLSVPLSVAGQIARGQDFQGNKVWNPYQQNNSIPKLQLLGNTIMMLLQSTPQPLQSVIEYGTGRVSAPQAIGQALELPVRFYNQPKK